MNRNDLPHLNFLKEDHENYMCLDKENNVSMDDDSGEGGDEEILSYRDFDHDVTQASFLLSLRKKFNATTEVISYVSEKIYEIICLERKTTISMIKESLKRNHVVFQLNCETEMIVDYESPFTNAFDKFDKFKGKKYLYGFAEKQKFYVRPNQTNIGFNLDTQKEDSVQWVSLLNAGSNDNGMISCYCMVLPANRRPPL